MCVGGTCHCEGMAVGGSGALICGGLVPIPPCGSPGDELRFPGLLAGVLTSGAVLPGPEQPACVYPHTQANAAPGLGEGHLSAVSTGQDWGAHNITRQGG